MDRTTISHDNSGDHSTVIVAVPSKSDPIWEMSSEEVPHMTLLFLDKTPELESANTLEYIQHVASGLPSFDLSVVKRGVLGPEDADVVFFSKRGVSKLVDVRRYLLDNQEIRKAYDSVEQYPAWTPHLTMGFPKTPAKKYEYGGPYWIQFDRIALWTKDYEGYEFELETDNDFEELAVSMSETDTVDKVLEHYGTKGMKWGVRKSSSGSSSGSGGSSKGSSGSDSGDANRKDNTTFAIAKARGTGHVSTPELKSLVARLQLEKQFKELTAKKPGLLAKGAKMASAIIADVAQKQAKAYLNNMVGQAIKDGGSSGKGKTNSAKGTPKDVHDALKGMGFFDSGKTYGKANATATPRSKFVPSTSSTFTPARRAIG